MVKILVLLNVRSARWSKMLVRLSTYILACTIGVLVMARVYVRDTTTMYLLCVWRVLWPSSWYYRLSSTSFYSSYLCSTHPCSFRAYDRRSWLSGLLTIRWVGKMALKIYIILEYHRRLFPSLGNFSHTIPKLMKNYRISVPGKQTTFRRKYVIRVIFSILQMDTSFEPFIRGFVYSQYSYHRCRSIRFVLYASKCTNI